MPKGKILMGKDPKPKMERNPGNRKRALPVPYDTIRNADPVPYETISNPDRNKKRPLPMPRPMPGDNKKRPLPMPRPIPGRKRPVPMPGDRTLPKRGPVKPRTPEERKFIYDELRRNPRRGTPRGKGGISDPKRKSPTPDQMKEKQAMAKPKPKDIKPGGNTKPMGIKEKTLRNSPDFGYMAAYPNSRNSRRNKPVAPRRGGK